ncbi:MAG: imidazole glycerol phosphate synthase subunit HisH [Candidatus Omnitrophica bacterium]|nr:imidazole glycerol phosphate synthase subunit HisH [Candidatus Omnitrophota bacterium]
MISILNYGMGNIRSIQNALNFLGIESNVIDSAAEIIQSHKLILPGVGSFRMAMENIRRQDFFYALNEVVLNKRIPILGICLGMQLMAQESEEDGLTKGFGWIKGLLKRFPADNPSIKIPHVGFNTVFFEKNDSVLFRGLNEKADFYHTHSYRIPYDAEVNEFSGWSLYGERFVSCIESGNICGTQFHPEKSQSNGLILLKNFAEFK